MMQAAIRYGEQLAREPLQIMVTRTQQFAGLWLVGLHAVALRVVSGFSVGATWGAFITLAALFVGIPWMFRLAVQRAVL